MVQINNMIEEVSATGEEVHAVIAALEPILLNVKPSLAVIACIEIAIVAQNPELTVDQLHEGVKGCSQWIAMYLTGLGEIIPASKVN